MTTIFSGTSLNPAINTENQTGTSINIKNNNNSEKTAGVQGAFAGVVMSAGDKKIDNNTYESLLKETEDVKSQIMESASNAKLGLKALMKKLSGADAVRIDEDGFNLTDATKDDMVNIVEKIKIELAMHSDDYVNFGTGVSNDAIEAVAGSAGLANSIESKMHNANVAVNNESVEEVNSALDKVANLSPLSEDAKNYMVANNVEPSIDGIAQAENISASVKARPVQSIDETTFEGMRSQIETVISRAGLEVNDANVANAKSFIENQIPVTEENLIYKSQLDELNISDIVAGEEDVLDKILENMSLGNSAGSTKLTGDSSLVKEVSTAIDTLEKATVSDVADVVNKGEVFTIASLKLSIETRITTGKGYFEASFSASATMVSSSVDMDEAYNSLVEARILMTAQSGAFLYKNNISLLTTPITDLVSQLKKLDMADMKNVFDNSDMDEDTFEGSYQELTSVRFAMDSIKYSPVALFTDIIKRGDNEAALTLSELSNMGAGLKRQYERAGQTYEAVGTEVRKDLGDSLKSAVANSTDNLIEEIGLEGTKADRDAIRILAMNNMDINKENVDKIKESYAIVNNLIDNMKPETVFNMIKDGINPMETELNQLNEYLTSMNDAASKDNEEKFSKFLYKLDRTKGIDAAQRKKFIGIYQMMNIFTKDAGASVGALVKQGSEITMNNLMSAYNSRKHYGMDRTISDETGMAEISGTVNYYSALFAQNGIFCTPNTLKNVDNGTGIGPQSVENFVEQLEENYDAELEAEYFEEYMQVQMAAAEADSAVLRDLRRADTDATFGNIQAVKQLLESGQFPVIKGVGNGKSTEDFARESLEKIGHEKDLKHMFDEMEDATKEELQEAISLAGDLDTEVELNYEELLDLRIRNNQIGYINNLAARHDYKIPFISEDGDVGMINLTLVSDSENKGRISINLSSKTFGKISLEAKVDSEKLGLFVVSDVELEEDAKSQLGNISDKVREEFGFDEVNVYTGTSENVPYVTYDEAADSVASDKLYEIAGYIVKAFV